MATDDNSDGDIQFHFFKAITTRQKSYFCDFHRVEFKTGEYHYRVVLQSHNQKDIVTDLHKKENAWGLTEPNDDVSSELEWLLVTAILEHNK